MTTMPSMQYFLSLPRVASVKSPRNSKWLLDQISLVIGIYCYTPDFSAYNSPASSLTQLTLLYHGYNCDILTEREEQICISKFKHLIDKSQSGSRESFSTFVTQLKWRLVLIRRQLLEFVCNLQKKRVCLLVCSWKNSLVTWFAGNSQPIYNRMKICAANIPLDVYIRECGLQYLQSSQRGFSIVFMK